MADREITVRLRIGRREALAAFVLALLALHPAPLATENLTLTTYYPSPYGVYTELRATNDAYFAYGTSPNNFKVGIGTQSPGKRLDVVGSAGGISGDIRASGEITSTLNSGYGQFRAIAGGYGAMIRNDGSDTYMPLLTSNGNQYGVWNGLRPIRVNDGSGDVYLANSQDVFQHSNGYLGVGTTSPQTNLHVVGNAYVTAQVETPQLNTNTYPSNCFDQWYANNATTNCPGGTYATLIDGVKAPIMRVGGETVSFGGSLSQYASGGSLSANVDSSGYMRCCY